MSNYTNKRKLKLVPHLYPTTLRGVVLGVHWPHGSTPYQREKTSRNETASLRRLPRYHQFVEDAQRWRLLAFERMR